MDRDYDRAKGDLHSLNYYLRGQEPTIKAPTFYCNKAARD